MFGRVEAGKDTTEPEKALPVERPQAQDSHQQSKQSSTSAKHFTMVDSDAHKQRAVEKLLQKH
jgi:hypothetical protein